MKKPELWEERWKKFLYEGITYRVVKTNKLNSIFDFFHISDRRLSDDDYFIFTPRIPRRPYEDWEGNITEDDFTPRISVAPTIENALKAIEGQEEFFEGWMHLYAGFGPTDAEAKQEDCPETPDQEYDTNFTMSKWLYQKLFDKELSVKDATELNMSIPPRIQPKDFKPKKHASLTPRGIRPRILPTNLKDEFEQCVPDADETNENWMLKPTKMIYIGELDTKNREVILSSIGLSIVDKAKIKTREY